MSPASVRSKSSGGGGSGAAASLPPLAASLAASDGDERHVSLTLGVAAEPAGARSALRDANESHDAGKKSPWLPPPPRAAAEGKGEEELGGNTACLVTSAAAPLPLRARFRAWDEAAAIVERFSRGGDEEEGRGTREGRGAGVRPRRTGPAEVRRSSEEGKKGTRG